MSTFILDGKKIAVNILKDVSTRTQSFIENNKRSPKIVLLQVGEDADSSKYLRSKHKKAIKCGFEVFDLKLDKEISQQELEDKIQSLNSDSTVDAILLQLPLPGKLNSLQALNTISPDKDVDGLTSANQEKLSRGEANLVPCTPLGVLKLIKIANKKIRETEVLKGLKAVVIGRSKLVGKPTACLLQQEEAIVTVCHSQTENINKHTIDADIIVAAAGAPALVTKDMIKPGAILIDVGITYLNGSLKGDVDFEGCKNKAAAITPVPGGVGPMTIAMLMQNTIKAAEKR